MSDQNPYESPNKRSTPAKTNILSSPPPEEKGFPKGIPYIIGNEFAERFSFYGMKAILATFIAQVIFHYLPEEDAKFEATIIVHTFVFAVYFTPLLGSLISDVFLGKYRTIMILSVVYCLGHLALAAIETKFGLYLGLTLIAIGAGGIKPCVSAHVGDQFGPKNSHLLSKVFSWFYFSINVGSAISMVLIPWIKTNFTPQIAFAIPGLLMFLATVVFWMGRYRFVHVPATGWEKVKESFQGEGTKAILRLSLIYLLVAMFWSLFDQTATKWVFQGQEMVRSVNIQWLSFILPESMGDTYLIDSESLQAVNPILVLILIPLFSFVIYPAIDKFFRLTPLRKISLGMFLNVVAFGASGFIQLLLDQNVSIHILWQIVPYILLTAAEIMVSITCLEFSYTQAPKALKSIIMSIYLLSVSFGNLITVATNYVIKFIGQEHFAGANYYWLFTAMMFIAALLFVVVAQNYRGKTYTDGEESN